jgi:hypothetical protein
LARPPQPLRQTAFSCSVRAVRGAVSSLVTLALCAALLFTPGGAVASTPEQDAYAARFLLVNDKIVGLGEEVGRAFETADRRTDGQLARRFSSFARRLGRLTERLTALAPPAEWDSHHDELLASLPPVESDLRRIARAARNHNPVAAARAAADLIRHSRTLRGERRTLYRTIELALQAP